LFANRVNCVALIHFGDFVDLAVLYWLRSLTRLCLEVQLMRTRFPLVFAYAITFLFFIQMAGVLVESIYILDLLNTSLDARALGLLFFFSPVVLLVWRKPFPGWLVGLFFLALLEARGLIPYLDTNGRLLSAGIGTSVVLLLLPVIISARPKREPRSVTGIEPAAGLALAVALSVLLRSLDYSLDYSLTPVGGWIGWGLGLLLGFVLLRLELAYSPAEGGAKSPTLALCGAFLVLTLIYFAFSAPAVIARWTAGSYPGIVLGTSLLALIWLAVTLYQPGWFVRLSTPVVFIWNLLFTLVLTATLFAQRVSFPVTAESPPVVAGPPGLPQQLLLGLLLLLFPVLFVDIGRFVSQVQQAEVSTRAYVPGMLLGGLVLVVLIFADIFTNVWGYVEPVSPFFRNKYWLPFALAGIGLILLSLRSAPSRDGPAQRLPGTALWAWAGSLAVLCGLTAWGVLHTDRIATQDKSREVGPSSLLVMTYNIQQANDVYGEKAYDRQLALIRSVNPDVLALQESDSARIGLNNNDYVRYFASRLGYYSYYGPSTVTGTFGTALLSRYPLKNPRTVYTYSDKDEIATAEAELDFDGRVFTFYNVHPDGSDTAMNVFAQTLLARAASHANVIILGDFNLREDEAAYQSIAAVYTNAWMSIYPSGINPDSVDMSGNKRTDHIFFSPKLHARNPMYVLPPESATDHPAHWSEITWER
jgi:endonuclease/exonuclease/phosphatase family metal-dependent hydrolase